MTSVSSLHCSTDDLYAHLEGTNPVRLISLLAGHPSDKVRVKVVSTNLGDAVNTYEVTSYTWGDPTVTHIISCNGRNFTVTTNAYQFLRRLRLEDKDRLLWMDSICINQADDEEKAQQVPMMGDIYQSARRVVIWLGEACKNSDMAMNFAADLDISISLEEFAHSKWTSSQHSSQPRNTYLLNEANPSDDRRELIQSLCSLVQRPWTRRAWVQQEAALCKDTVVMCGSCSIPWDHFFAISWMLTAPNTWQIPEWIEYDSMVDSLLALNYIQSTRHSISGGRSTTIWGTLSMMSACLATDPRDKIFATYGLVRQAHFRSGGSFAHKLPKVDYSLPWQVVYIKCAKLIGENVLFDWNQMLLRAGRAKQRDLSLPSWVPDWRYTTDLLLFLDQDYRAGGTQKAENPYTLRFAEMPRRSRNDDDLYTYFTPSGKRKTLPIQSLALQFIMQDVVIYTSGCLDSEKRGSDFHCELAEFVKSTEQRLLTLSPSTYINGETILEALAKTLLCSRDYKEFLIEPEVKLESEYQRYLQSFLAGVVNHELPYARDFLLSSALDETQLCITARGYMCLVPKKIQNGDYIGVACGVQMPLAFRKVGQDAKGQLQYELYSEVYVHGMMYSQTWNLMEDYRPKFSAEEYAFLNSEPPSKVLQSPGTFKKRENFVSALDVGYEQVLATIGKRTIVFI
ncbi:HET-like protein [Alternaria alternata]|nr:HET-like protein [Alternaria alternata]